MKRILICGSRGTFKNYEAQVRSTLDQIKETFEIIEGCCPMSADQYAEKYAKEKGIKIWHFPSTSGNYLARNIEMVKFCDEVIGFHDNFSYGTAHAIAYAVFMKKPVTIIQLRRK